ncbi:MAG TPA: hypothetical protein VFV49_09675, partial [Thermoanaerobaculia bacterium]|nr:hypothetical protein [Thermoanaerobaculia bacterium]
TKGKNMEQHIKVLSVLFIILGILGIVVAVAFMLLGAGTAATILAQDDSNEAKVGAAWAGGCITFVAALFGIMAIPSIIAGWGLSQRKSWARILTIILAILSLPQFPVGTAIGVYALVILFNEETKQLLTA